MLLTDYYPRYMSEHERLRECMLTGYESVFSFYCQPLAYHDAGNSCHVTSDGLAKSYLTFYSGTWVVA